MKFLTAALAAAILLQCATAPASAAQRGVLMNGTKYVLTLRLQVYGRVERLELAPWQHHSLPSLAEGASGTVTVDGRPCLASTPLTASSEVVFKYFPNDKRCAFERWIG